VKIIKEPGGTALGEAIRSIVTLPREMLFSLGGRGPWQRGLVPPRRGAQLAQKDVWLPLTPEAEAFLFAASRAQLMSEVIRPALGRETAIICDRFIYSTLAYQGYGRGINLDLLRVINEAATGGLLPDLVILLDLEATRGLRRKRRSKDLSRFEEEDPDFHRRVREGYLKLAAADPSRWVVVDAARNRRAVADDIWAQVKRLLPPREPEGTPPDKAGEQPPPKPLRLLP
jgi:dTMP kinase